MQRMAMSALMALAWVAVPLSAAALPPSCESIVAFAADPPQRSPSDRRQDFTVSQADLCVMLGTYHEVTEDQWLHAYHHVALADRTGRITLEDGAVWQWLVRPGGLVKLSMANGGAVFLAREKRN